MDKLNCSVAEISELVDELIDENAVLPFYVSGSSMNPFLISRRDIVYLKKPQPDDLKKGRILLFRRKDGALVLHRVKCVLNDSVFVMLGDAQSQTEKIDKAQIVAVVSEIERKGKIRKAESSYWKTIYAIWRMFTPFRPFIMRVWFKIRRIKRKNRAEF